VNIAALERKILAHHGLVAGYRHLDKASPESTRLAQQLSLDQDEGVLGIYVNPEPFDGHFVVVTTRGLYSASPRRAVERILYRDIRSVHGPSTSASAECQLRIELGNGSSKSLSICGRHGRFRDIFEFLRFVMRATEKPND
jgi:hypothetical protein